jgi:mRNA-degrading endonuclease YafQ of YafQ-DinJ toxin-antitoxin module
VPVELRLSKQFLKSLGNPSDQDHARTEEALRQLQDLWGAPHTHAGLSIRRLQGGYFECRVGLDLRLVFRAGLNGLDLVLAGRHDDVRRLLRNE